jgi:hypothetical protein
MRGILIPRVELNGLLLLLLLVITVTVAVKLLNHQVRTLHQSSPCYRLP